MKEWFKARNVWFGAFTALSDAEAGRLAKALWAYTATGEEVELSGNEKGCFAMIKFTLQLDESESNDLSEVRRQAGQKGAEAKKANASFAKANEANEANADNKNKSKNKNIYTNTTARAREESSIGTVEVDPLILKVQQELNGLTDTHYQAMNDFREELGDDVVGYAIDKAVGNGVRNWSYVEAVLRGWVKAGVRSLGEAKAENEKHKQQPVQKPKLLRAQDYEQRDYDEQEMRKILGVDSLFREDTA